VDSQRGRPSKAEQLRIQKMIRPYFDLGLSAHFVSTLPGMPNEKTIQKYFKQWTKDLSKDIMKSFDQIKSEVIGKTQLIFDKQILNIAILQNDLMEYHQESKREYEEKRKKSEFLGNKHLGPYKPDLELIRTLVKLDAHLFELKDIKMKFEIMAHNPETGTEKYLKEVEEMYKERVQTEKEMEKTNKRIRELQKENYRITRQFIPTLPHITFPSRIRIPA
jgi:hypothetical protein